GEGCVIARARRFHEPLGTFLARQGIFGPGVSAPYFGDGLLLGQRKLLYGSLSLRVGEPDFVFLAEAGENGPLHSEKSAVILKSEAHLFERPGTSHGRV